MLSEEQMAAVRAEAVRLQDGTWTLCTAHQGQRVGRMLDSLLAEVAALRTALRLVMAEWTLDQDDWCHCPENQLGRPCGKCPGCLAWQQAQDVLKEVGDAE